jgi:F-type H+-transporting ATPase subunit gamma
MANTRELRRRIKSVKNISQITKAMQMVAATKMRRAQNQALGSRPYSDTLTSSLNNLVSVQALEAHPLMTEKTAKDTGVILLSTDKTLCGALNTNLFRTTQNFSKEKPSLNFYTVGKKGRDFIVRTSKKLEADFENSDQVTFQLATQIAKLVTDAFLKNEVKEVYLIYPHFVSTLTQEPRVVKLLPIDKELFQHLVNPKPKDDKGEFLIEPNATTLLDFVLNHYIQTRIFAALLETKASEHAARMMAMQNATNNAQDLVTDLNLNYNQIRQSSITQELLEITSAGAALE